MSNRDAVFCVRCGGLAREMLGVAGTAGVTGASTSS
jgi:hypothetical protein